MERRSRRESAPLPAVGTVVELRVSGVSRTWRTRVEALEGRRLLVVAPTRGDGSPYVVPHGTGSSVIWNTDTALLRASTTVTGADVDVVPRWWLTVTVVERVQRRGAFRLRVARPVRLAMEGTQLEGVTDDLSETGALVVVPAPADAVAGQQVRVRLAIEDQEELLLDAEVVRVTEVKDGHRALGLRFLDLDEQLSDRVRRFVLEEQFRGRGGG